ncbi:MAG: hypothetical protein ABIJ23_04975 [Candidatus Magasanikbacteria bacterium]
MQEKILTKEMDKCQHLLNHPTQNLVDTCRRTWMLQVWLTTEPKIRYQLALQTYQSMLEAMKIGGWDNDKMQRYLLPFKQAELDLSPSP